MTATSSPASLEDMTALRAWDGLGRCQGLRRYVFVRDVADVPACCQLAEVSDACARSENVQLEGVNGFDSSHDEGLTCIDAPLSGIHGLRARGVESRPMSPQQRERVEQDGVGPIHHEI